MQQREPVVRVDNWAAKLTEWVDRRGLLAYAGQVGRGVEGMRVAASDVLNSQALREIVALPRIDTAVFFTFVAQNGDRFKTPEQRSFRQRLLRRRPLGSDELLLLAIADTFAAMTRLLPVDEQLYVPTRVEHGALAHSFVITDSGGMEALIFIESSLGHIRENVVTVTMFYLLDDVGTSNEHSRIVVTRANVAYTRFDAYDENERGDEQRFQKFRHGQPGDRTTSGDTFYELLSELYYRYREHPSAQLTVERLRDTVDETLAEVLRHQSHASAIMIVLYESLREPGLETMHEDLARFLTQSIANAALDAATRLDEDTGDPDNIHILLAVYRVRSEFLEHAHITRLPPTYYLWALAFFDHFWLRFLPNEMVARVGGVGAARRREEQRNQTYDSDREAQDRYQIYDLTYDDNNE